MIIGDISDFAQVTNALKNTDIVYNLAAISDIEEASNTPLETIKINVIGNLNILEACKRKKIKKFIFASSVYVNSREGSFYRISKQAAEETIEEYNNLYGIDYTILRYGSIYGPRSDDRNNLYRIIKKAIKSKKIIYQGHIEASREYIHVLDVANTSVAAIDKKFSKQIVVLTGNENLRVIDILKMIAEMMNINQKNIKFKNTNHKGHYIRTPYAYNPKIVKKYIPSFHVDLGQGLLDLIKDIKKKINQ